MYTLRADTLVLNLVLWPRPPGWEKVDPVYSEYETRICSDKAAGAALHDEPQLRLRRGDPKGGNDGTVDRRTSPTNTLSYIVIAAQLAHSFTSPGRKSSALGVFGEGDEDDLAR